MPTCAVYNMISKSNYSHRSPKMGPCPRVEPRKSKGNAVILTTRPMTASFGPRQLQKLQRTQQYNRNKSAQHLSPFPFLLLFLFLLLQHMYISPLPLISSHLLLTHFFIPPPLHSKRPRLSPHLPPHLSHRPAASGATAPTGRHPLHLFALRGVGLGGAPGRV